MTRFARATVVSLLCLLSFATSASGEGAWIEWTHIESDNPAAPLGGASQIRAAHATREECEVSAGKATDSMQKRGTLSKRMGGHVYFTSFVCLSDTIDPRAPKGR
jgi:hypothetical protein